MNLKVSQTVQYYRHRGAAPRAGIVTNVYGQEGGEPRVVDLAYFEVQGWVWKHLRAVRIGDDPELSPVEGYFLPC